MTETGGMDQLSLLGGPLHRLGCRLGLVRGGTNTVLVGIALGTLSWLVLVLLAWVEGVIPALFSLDVIGGHVRLLVVIPLFFVCESALDPQIRAFASYSVRSGVVTAGALPAFESQVARTMRWKGAWLPEVGCLAAAVLMGMAAPALHLSGTTAVFDPDRAASGISLAAWWYWTFGLTLFRFLMFRWIWRLGLWFNFLWRLSRLELHLMPVHADRAGGLGNLEFVHTQFVALIVAISVLQAASFAEDIVAGTMAFDAIYPAFALILVADALLFLLPLFVFAPKLWACRLEGLRDYMEMAARYATGFDRKWVGPDAAPGEPLLGTPDLQSLADLSNAVTIVSRMRWVPISPRLLTAFLIAALLPMLPLLLLKYPVAELAEQFLSRLSGL